MFSVEERKKLNPLGNKYVHNQIGGIVHNTPVYSATKIAFHGMKHPNFFKAWLWFSSDGERIVLACFLFPSVQVCMQGLSCIKFLSLQFFSDWR